MPLVQRWRHHSEIFSDAEEPSARFRIANLTSSWHNWKRFHLTSRQRRSPAHGLFTLAPSAKYDRKEKLSEQQPQPRRCSPQRSRSQNKTTSRWRRHRLLDGPQTRDLDFSGFSGLSFARQLRAASVAHSSGHHTQLIAGAVCFGSILGRGLDGGQWRDLCVFFLGKIWTIEIGLYAAISMALSFWKCPR